MKELGRMTDEELVSAYGAAASNFAVYTTLSGKHSHVARGLAARAVGFKRQLLARMKDLREGRIPRKKPVAKAVAGRRIRK